MSKISRGLNLLTKEEKDKAIKKIIAYFLDERDEEIGIIAATSIWDFFEQEIAPIIYDKAIEDTKKTLREEMEELDFKLTELKKSQ